MQLNTKLNIPFCNHLLQCGQFDTLLQHCTREVAQCLQAADYKKALDYYEYILAAMYSLGQFKHLSRHIVVYGKLCHLTGTTYHWTQYYRYLSFCQSFKKEYSLAIQSAKRSIYNAFQLSNYECISLGYGTLAMLYLRVDEQQQADFSLKLAHYYSEQIEQDDSTMRSQLSLLYFYSTTNNIQLFTLLRDKLLAHINEETHPFYLAKIYLFECIIHFHTNNHEQCIKRLNLSISLLQKHGLTIYLYYLVDLFQRTKYRALFQEDQLQQLIHSLNLDIEAIQHTLETHHHYLFKQNDAFDMLNAASKPTVELVPLLLFSDIVNTFIKNNEHVTMLSFSLNDQKVSNPLEKNTHEQFFYDVFSLATEVLNSFNYLCTHKYNNDGIIVIKGIVDVEIILPKIYQAVRKLTEKNRIINPQLPIHFGVAYSNRIDQPTFESLYKKSSAALYYAKTTNKLYIM